MKQLFLFFSLLTACISHAQFNDSVHYHLKYGTTGIINKTNDRNSFVLTNTLGFNIKKKTISFNSNSSWIYGKQNGTISNNDFSSSFFTDVLEDRKIYYWGLASFISSYSLKIKHQFQLGAGIGWNIAKTPKLQLLASNGLLYENSKIINTSAEQEQYQTIRNSFRLRHKWQITDLLSIEGTHYWQPSLTISKDYILKSNATAAVKLRKWLNLTSAITYNYISRTERENLLFTFGLVAENYF